MTGKYRGVILLVLIMASFSFPPQSSAFSRRSAVLGASTSVVNFPPVTAGPGMFLPDSSFYFLDLLFQNVKLAVAFSPEEKVKVRAAVAQERLAEVRVMVSRQDEQGVKRALAEMTKEAMALARSIKDADAQGKDVVELSLLMNEELKSQRAILRQVALQTNGSLRLQIEVARQGLDEAKIIVEEALPEEVLERELLAVFADEIESIVGDTENDIATLETYISALEQEASESAQRALKKRQKALSDAINEKNTLLREEQMRLLTIEEEKHERILQARMEAADLAKKSIREAREAAVRYKEAQKSAQEAAQHWYAVPSVSPTRAPQTAGASTSAR